MVDYLIRLSCALLMVVVLVLDAAYLWLPGMAEPTFPIRGLLMCNLAYIFIAWLAVRQAHKDKMEAYMAVKEAAKERLTSKEFKQAFGMRKKHA